MKLQHKHINCDIILSVLKVIKHVVKHAKITVHKHKQSTSSSKSTHLKTNHRYMSKPQLINKSQLLQSEIKRRNYVLNKYNQTKKLQYQIHTDLLTIMNEHHENVITTYPEHSFQHTSQYNAANTTAKQHYRQHPTLIKWCIYFADSSFGFSDDLDDQLARDSAVDTLQPFQKDVRLLGDEMYIKEGLVYNKHSGELIGYSNLGNINTHLQQLQMEYTCTYNTKDSTENNKLAIWY